MAVWRLGIIGGSGLYQIEALEGGHWEAIASPWGEPSDAVYRGRLADIELVFLPRHGRGHRLSPTQLNYRANIDVLKRAGCTDVISLSACGSLREHIRPGEFVVVDQFVDRTVGRAASFFGQGIVAHVSMAHPVCPRLSALLGKAAKAQGVTTHHGGTYIAIEGPQFSTLAESRLYRAWGCDVIGMTNLPEAKLAREAELPYATVAMVTDYDCWHAAQGPVSVADVLFVMQTNVEHARALVRSLAEALSETPRTPDPLGIETCLNEAIITPRSQWDSELAARLDAVMARVLDQAEPRETIW